MPRTKAKLSKHEFQKRLYDAIMRGQETNKLRKEGKTQEEIKAIIYSKTDQSWKEKWEKELISNNGGLYDVDESSLPFQNDLISLRIFEYIIDELVLTEDKFYRFAYSLNDKPFCSEFDIDTPYPEKCWNGHKNMTFLCAASVRGHTELVALFISRFNANVNKCDSAKWTPLHFACFFGRTDIVGLLISANAKIGIKNIEGLCALSIAKNEMLKPQSKEKKDDLKNIIQMLNDRENYLRQKEFEWLMECWWNL
jgi:ankyrin repeat protein